MSSFTINNIFDLLKERRALLNPAKGGYRFDRKERVEYIFPGSVCKEIASRSASYYSWFLNMDKQGVPIRDYLRSLFEEDSYEVIHEMTEKCARLPGEGRSLELDTEVWQELLNMAGRAVPLLVRGSEGADRIGQMVEAAPHRALAWLFLAAGMDGFTPEQYLMLNDCWRLMDQMDLTDIRLEGGTKEALRRLQAGKILYLDGNRTEALQQFRQAAEKLRTALRKEQAEVSSSKEKINKRTDSEEQSGKRELLGEILFQIGNIYYHGTGESKDRGRAGVLVCSGGKKWQCGCGVPSEPAAVEDFCGRLQSKAGSFERSESAAVRQKILPD